MPIEPLPDLTTPLDEPSKDTPAENAEPVDQPELPVNLSEFSQRLASFGLGEAPDPLLTEARPPVKRRRR
jgi:hypothetical protein